MYYSTRKGVVLSGVAANDMRCFVQGVKNGMGCFVPGCFVLHSHFWIINEVRQSLRW